jgi:hypothetical protein
MHLTYIFEAMLDGADGESADVGGGVENDWRSSFTISKLDTGALFGTVAVVCC